VTRAAGPGIWRGRAALAELHGSAVHVEVELRGFRVAAVADSATGLDSGDEVGVPLDGESVHFFDGRTGDRLRRAGG
jgi:hypothetical protein